MATWLFAPRSFVLWAFTRRRCGLNVEVAQASSLWSKAGILPARAGWVSVHRSAVVLGRSKFGTLQCVGHFAGRAILQRFCARGRAHSATRVPDWKPALPDRLEACPTTGTARIAVVMLFFFCLVDVARAQEAIRMSLASEEAARARRKAATTAGYYNLTLGPTLWKFGAGLGLEYNDNVSLNGTDQEDDFIFRPSINTDVLWPITDKNSLNLRVGAGYSAYVNHPGLDRIFITPGSELSFDVYAGDFWINLHDRFSITESAYQDPTVAGTGDYARLENAVGVSTLWDLNKVNLRFGYDHADYLALYTNTGQPDGQSELFSSSAAYVIKPGMLLGIELGGGLLNYSGTNTVFSKAHQWSVGSFYDTQLSQHLHARVSVGYSVYRPDATGTLGAPGTEFSGVYAQIAISHRLNQYVDYTLSGGRSLNFALYGGTVDLYFARLNASWKIMQKVSIGTSFDFEHGSQVSFGSETFDRYGAGINLARAITSKLSGSLGYQYYWRTSDLSGRDYTVNSVTLNLRYQF